MTTIDNEDNRILDAVKRYREEHQDIDRLYCVDVDTANGKYYATPHAQVISFCKSIPTELAQNTKDNDYVYVTIGDKKYYLHRIIAFTFLKCDDKEHNVVHHIDGNKRNNDLSNLLIVTPKRHQQIHYFLNKWSRIVYFDD